MSVALQSAAQKKIALIAHDHKKEELRTWALLHKTQLAKHILFATGTTGLMVQKALELPVVCFESGPLGGDLQIGSHLVEGKIDVVFFFWDPLESQPHDPDIRALLRIAAVWNVPLACNSMTATLLLTSPLFEQPYERPLEDYAEYKARNALASLPRP